jgi:flagellar basal body-associated protein FliL
MHNLALFLLQNQPDADQARQAMMAMAAIIPIMIIIMLIVVAIIIVPFWFICKKAGFSPWLALLNLIPLGNLVLLYVLAFADWKVVPLSQIAPVQPPYPPPYPPR